VTSVILAAGGVAFLFFDASDDTLTYLNMMRLIRVLKALNNIPAYQVTIQTIQRMMSSCGNVIMMIFLVLYVFAAIGHQAFGGLLYQDNPAFKDKKLDYFDSHFEVYNFNDMGMSFVTLFLVMITNWIPQVAEVLAALYPTFSGQWFFATGFSLAFYVLSPLLVFNVFTAFSIDVYLALQEYQEKIDEEGIQDEVMKNLAKLQEDFAAKGKVIHVYTDIALLRRRIEMNMFEMDDDDDNDDK
jgi:hypothetical protein